jgi:hypothetical protein
MTILRNRKEITSETPTADLLETYNAMTGKEIKKFSSRAAAESQTAAAIMAAEDASGKLGVKKGQKPVAMTFAELEAARAAKASGAESQQAAKSASGATAEPKAKATPKPAPKATSLRASLAGKAQAAPNAPRPKSVKKAEGEGRAPKVCYVELVKGGGRSKMQEGSQRRAVFEKICAMKSESPKSPVNVDDVQEKFHSPVRGHILKLIFEGHLVAAEAPKA